MMGIYAIENVVTGECYVGQSKNIISRFQQHMNMLEKGEHHSHKLQRAFNQMAIQNFILKILELCEEDQLDVKEQEWIDKLNSLNAVYNVKFNGVSDRVQLIKVKKRSGIFIPLPPDMTEKEVSIIGNNEQLMNQIGNLVRSAISINNPLTKSEVEELTKTQHEKEHPEKKLPKKKLRDKNIKRAKRWALKYYNQNGKLPGRVKIERGAKVCQTVARKALKELEEKLEINKAS
ncbi:GIY-YIG nuclease family protein [Laceyella putida]|uniref:GIY-YIG nuclease family protein n=1 Tax=Laceyella putida TaxID=110101 RepID=A0ABW2RF28_9BACL